MAITQQASNGWSAVIRIRPVTYLLSGNFVSTVGTQVQQAVVMWLMYELTGSSAMVGLLVLAIQMPQLVFSLPAGAMADRHDRRLLLLASQLALLGSSAVLALLVATDRASSPVLFAATAIVGLGTAVMGPAWIAEIGVRVPASIVYAGYSLNSVTAHSAIMLGPPFGAFLLQAVGASWAIVFNAVSYAVIVAAIVGLPRSPVAPHRRERGAGKGEVVDFLRRSDRARLLLPVCTGIALVTNGLPALLPAYADEVLGGDASRYGLLLGGMGAGGLLGGILLGVIPVAVARRRLVQGAVCSVAAGTVLLAVAPVWPVAVVAMFFVGVGNLVGLVTARTVVQLDAPEHLRGRVLSLWFMSTVIATPIGSLVVGVSTDRFDPRTITAATAVYATALALFIATRASSRTVVPYDQAALA